jgi:hypothetical protein
MHSISGDMEREEGAAHGVSRGIISVAQGGKFKAGFAAGMAGSLFNPGTTLGNDTLGEAGGFVARTTIAGIAGGTASELGGGKFANGAMAGAFVHMFNAEGGFREGIKKSLNTVWGKLTDGTIGRDALQGLKGGLEGYREVRDNSPWYARGMLKAGMTAVELGATRWISDPVTYIYVNVSSGVYLDTVPLTPVGVGAQVIHYNSSHDATWFK